MKLNQAINLNPSRASKLELELAISELKRQYVLSSNALKRRGRETEVMKTVEERMSHDPALYEKKVGQLTINEAREVFQTFRDYQGHRTYDSEGRFTGYEENVTRTLSGYEKYMERVGTEVLGYEDYVKLNQSAQKDLWELIDQVRNSVGGESYFRSSKVEPSALYQSGTNIKLVMDYIKSGITDPVVILERLRAHVEDVQIEQLDDEFISPFNL